MANKKSLIDRLTYAYIRKIKRWMFCPACKKGKLIINKKSTLWTCEECGYKLAVKEFEDDYVFWFCDECESYLNIQDGFKRNAKKHLCKKCGYENDTTFDNLKGVCSDCAKLLSNPDSTLCHDCKTLRLQKAKDILLAVGLVLGGIAAGVSVASSDESELGKCISPDNTGDNANDIYRRFDYVNEDWLATASQDELRATANEMQRIMDHELDYYSDEHSHLYGKSIDIGNAIVTRFPTRIYRTREHGWYLPNDD